jgi:AraC-like DNA-binding protein
LSVKETAAQCGFESEYYFSRFFHKFAGITPSQYRASLCRTPNQGRTAKMAGHKYAK